MHEILPQPAGSASGFRRGELLALALLVLVIVSLIVFLNLPLAGATVPEWLQQMQSQLRLTIDGLFPYVVVALLGGVVAIAELASTFETYPREALRTRWARILILINMVAAILALVVTRLTVPQLNNALQVLSVGIGFQALIRTRFVLAKSIGGDGKGEISLNLGWLYDQFQNICRTQIDLELMNNRRTAVTRLMEFYPSLTEIYDLAWYTIIARATLTPEEEATRLARLEKLLDPNAPEQFARASIALMVLENGGPAYVGLLLGQVPHAESAGDAAGQTTTKKLVWQLVDSYSLAELVALAERLTESEEVRHWVREAAQPDSETSEANQKAAIAHFLIQQVGAEKVQRALHSGVPAEAAPGSEEDPAAPVPEPEAQ